MLDDLNFPALKGWGATSDTLSLYVKVVGAVPRVWAEAQEGWRHVSLRLNEQGLRTVDMPRSREEHSSFHLLLNLQAHCLEIRSKDRSLHRLDLRQGLSANRLADEAMRALRSMGIEVQLDRSRFDDDNPRIYDAAVVGNYFQALQAVAQVMERHRETLQGERSPVQLWPHHFDLAFEWYGTRVVTTEVEGESQEQPAQINFGFAPGDATYADPYFYSNPWPFEGSLLESELPSGARWIREGFKGSILPYAELIQQPHPAQALLAYFKAVYREGAPLLTE